MITATTRISHAVLLPMDEDIYCDFCCQPLKDAYTIPCGHRYCRQCLIEIHAHENADLALQDGEVRLQQPGERLNLSVSVSQSQIRNPGSAKTAHCPLCLTQITSFERTAVMDTLLCQNCQKSKRTIRCADCNAELCAECDEKLHQFNLFKAHVRHQTSNAGNAHGAQLSMKCDAPEHEGEPQIAEFYCTERHCLLCARCELSVYYKNCHNIELEEAARQVKSQLAEVNENCRKLIAATRPLALKFEQITQFNQQQYEERISDLRTIRDGLIFQIREKFRLLEGQYQKMLTMRQEVTRQSHRDLCSILKQLADVQISSEKHVINRQDSVLLYEFEDLQHKASQQLDLTAESLQKWSFPEAKSLPELSQVSSVQSLIGELRLSDKEVILEQNYGSHQKTYCRDCENVLLDKEIKEIAVLQKGCLLGVKVEDLASGGVVLDAKLGNPQSRHALCRVCSKEIGRWSEPGCSGAKFSVGVVFLNQNMIK